MYTSNIAKNNMPLCSICIANYNGESFIEECIESVLKQQDFPGTLEIIVHDDASTDASVKLITHKYPQVRLIRSEVNVGFCVSNNRMVALARGEFILLLNNDAILHSDALKTLYTAFIENGEGIYGLPQYNAENGELIDYGSILDPFFNPIPNFDINRNDVGMIIGACLWLSKELWDIVGGFPEWFGSLAEDMYVCSFARLSGFHVKIISASGFYHYVGRSLGGGKVTNEKKLSTKISRRSKSERNKTFVMLICYPTLVFCIVLPVHLFVLIAEGVLLAVIKRDKRIWFDIYWFCLKEIWAKRFLWLGHRKIVQQSRLCSTSKFLSTFTLLPHKLRMFSKYGLPDVK